MASKQCSQFRSNGRAMALAAGTCIATLVMSGLPGVAASAQSSPAPPPAPKAAQPAPGAADPSLSPTTTIPPWDATPKDPSKPTPPPPPASATRPGGYDEKLSKTNQAQTTPTKAVYDNPDGSQTAKISTSPQRFKDSSGKWVDYDLSLVARADGSLGAKAAPKAAVLNKKADADVATVATDAGPVALRHPGANPAAAALDKGEAKYSGALPGGRDIKLTLTPDGFEESVVLPDALAPAAYTEDLVLPAGVSVRQTDRGVELLDKSGSPIATYGGGFAYDAGLTNSALPTPVSVRLVAQKANVATLEVAIESPAWLTAPDRSFPVTIDPTFTQLTGPGQTGLATTVISGTAADATPASTAYYGNLVLGVGLYSQGNKYRTLMRFDVSSIPTDAVVTYAHLAMWHNHTGFSSDCTGRAASAYALGAPFSTATTWNTQPAVTGAAVPIAAFANQPYPNGAGTNCPPNWVGLQVTSLAQSWVNGAANYGLELQANEADAGSFQHFWSASYGTGQYSPYLYVTWDRLPNPPTNVVATANADGSATVNWTLATLPANASPVDWYVVHALSTDLTTYAGDTAVVCATCTTATLTNLARSKDYRLGVYPHNGAGYSLAGSNQITTPADPLVRAGDSSMFSSDSFALTDHLGASVNLGTGNLEITASDMAIPVVGGARVLGRTYNSFALAPASTSKTSPLFGPAWRFSEAPDRRLVVNSDTSVTYLSASGNATVFAAGSLAAPTGVDAILVKNADATFTLTVPTSAVVMNFRSDGLLTSEVDRNANPIAFTYPASGYETSIAGNAGTTPGNTVTIAYAGPGGKVSSISKSAGGVTATVSYTYDAAGYLYQVTDADGTTTYGYNATTRNLESITDAAGRLTTFTFDASRRVTSVTRVIDAGNAVTGYDYSVATKTKVTDPNTNATTFTFAADGRMERALDARGVETVITWTSQLRVDHVEQGTPLQTLVQNVWTALSGSPVPNLTKVSSPTGAYAETNGYGAVHPELPTAPNRAMLDRLPTWSKDTMGRQSTYGYDVKGNMTSVTDPQANLSSSTFNGDGTVATSVMPSGATTTYGYTNHQLTSVTLPALTPASGSPLASSYDGFGRLWTSTSAAGMTTTFGYDGLDRVKTETHSDTTPTITSNYDPAGNLTSRADATGTTSYTYDKANRPRTKAAAGVTQTYTWDAAGNLKTAIDPAGTTTYFYDKLNRLDQVNEPTGRKDVFAYDIAGRRTDSWFNTGANVAYLGDAVIPPGSFAVHAHATYDAAGQLTALKTTRASNDATVVSDLSYAYTVPSGTTCAGAIANRPTSVRHAVTDALTTKTTSYCYDDAGRLTSATTSSGGPTYAYGFDANTNRTSGPEGTHTVNARDQLTDTGSTYDANGGLTAGGSLSALAYNGISQTTSITQAGNTTAYTYAGGGQDERTAAGPTTAVHGLLGLMTETTAGATTSYIRGPGGGLIAERTPGGDFYYVYDGQGSVIALVDPSGVQRAAYTYDPYGDHATAVGVNGTLPPNPWRWNGSYLDPTGLYKMGARYYDPMLGRFTQVDPVQGGSANAYDYCSGDPVNCSDRAGTKGNKSLPPELAGPCLSGNDKVLSDPRCVAYRTALVTGDSDFYYKAKTFTHSGKPNAFLQNAGKFLSPTLVHGEYLPTLDGAYGCITTAPAFAAGGAYVGGLAGTAIPIPGIGNLAGATVGGIAGGASGCFIGYVSPIVPRA